MAVVLADLLDAKHILLDLKARTRDDALREIVNTLNRKLTDPGKFFAEVVARETAHSTYLGQGVAFPHSRTELTPEILLGIGRSPSGVVFGENSELAHLIFLLAVPKRMVTDYLVCVGALARLTKPEESRRALMKAASAEEMIELLRAGSLHLE